MYPSGEPAQPQSGSGWPDPAAPPPGGEPAPPGYSVIPPGYPQPGQQQSPPGYPGGEYPQPAYPQPAYPQPSYPQSGHPQPGQQQPGYPQPGQQQPGYPQPAYLQPGYPHQQPVYPQPAAPQQAIYPQQGSYPPGYPPPKSNRSLVWVVASVAIVCMITVFAVAVYAVANSEDEPTDRPTTAAASPSTSTSPGALPQQPTSAVDGLVVGSGPIRVDVYVDYQCPPCSTYEELTAETLNGYLTSNRITLGIHPVAFIDDRSKNTYSTRAAAASACAHDAGRLMDFHSHLLRNQPAEDTFGPTDDQLASAGSSLGLGSGFASCVSGKQRIGWVRQATSAAQSRGVNQVPTTYVNDSKIGQTRADLATAVG